MLAQCGSVQTACKAVGCSTHARAIAEQLNSQGQSLRGGRFYNRNVAGILARDHYCGFNFDAKADEHGHPLSADQWARVLCPTIVSEEQHAAVAARRALRNPRKTAPRITTGVTMLPATIGRCGQLKCGAGLTVVTGKGGQYHYYACAERVNRGARSCDLQSLRREALDTIVLDALLERILAPEHLRELLAGLLERSDGADARRRKSLGNRASRSN
jgi:site-specific DNA recombinase